MISQQMIEDRDEMIGVLEEKCAVLTVWNAQLKSQRENQAELLRKQTAWLSLLGYSLVCDCRDPRQGPGE